MQRFPSLFSPIQIGTMTVKNRIFMPAIFSGLCNDDHQVTDRAIAYYAARAKGGAGLITTENVMVDERSRYGVTNNMGLFREDQVPDLRRLTDAVHAYGTKIVPQLLHAGTAATRAFNEGRQPRSASPIALRGIDEIPLAMPQEEIDELVSRFGEAARRARQAGFDGVEIHACHRHGILGSFLSPLSNKRVDAYGGSIDGRLRLPLEVIARVRREAGEDFPIIVRMSMTEEEPGGQSLLDAIYIARQFEAAGVSLLNLSNGTLETFWKTVTPSGTPRGVNTELAEKVKAAVTIPVGVNGRNCEPWAADLVIGLGRIDITYMGRALLCDPEFPAKAQEGREGEIRPCIGCTDCITHRYGQIAYCSMNPYSGRESFSLPPAEAPKRVLVAGGGPAGLEAATVAARRGFQVTLMEQADEPGGQMYLAGIPLGKQDIAIGTKFLIEEARRAGVDIRTGVTVTAETVRHFNPDAVIVATGGTPVVPGFLSGAKQLVSAWDVLAGRVDTGRNIVVIGGGAVGCETADFLIHPHNDRSPRGKRVTLIEMTEHIMADERSYSRSLLVRRMQEKGCVILTGAKVESVVGEQVTYSQGGSTVTLTGVDTVVAAMGTRPAGGLVQALEGSPFPVYSVGDCAAVGRIYEALRAGAQAAEIL